MSNGNYAIGYCLLFEIINFSGLYMIMDFNEGRDKKGQHLLHLQVLKQIFSIN